jgi:hypothetical protein
MESATVEAVATEPVAELVTSTAPKPRGTG